VDSWRVTWRESGDVAQQREFQAYLEAWDFNEHELKGQGEVTLLTDRPLPSQKEFPSEAAVARSVEGSPRRYPRKK
jgi:hypothetical protein